MGITGLIPFLDKATSKINIRQLHGSTVAVDTYCWLHKGAFAVADKLARKEETDIHIQYCLKYVNLLLSHDIKPILVFDGQHLPAKAATESKRSESRKEAKKIAMKLLREGRSDEARTYLRRCVDITHEMALQLIKACRAMNVDCIVAPYEADAQLAYLNKIKIADYVITEDSDLVLFGCSNIIFKLDLQGLCLLVDRSKLHLAMRCTPHHYSFSKFRYMCVLSGCDYLDSLPGIGLARACKFILKYDDDMDIRKSLLRLPSILNMPQITVKEEYIEEFLKAVATFQHMLVYDPLERKVVPLNDVKETGTDERFCSNAGSAVHDAETAFQLAIGNLDPFTLRKLDDWHPDRSDSHPKGGKTKTWGQTSKTKHPSIWKSKLSQITARRAVAEKKADVQHSKSLKFLTTKSYLENVINIPEAPKIDTSEDDILAAYSRRERSPSPESISPYKRKLSMSPHKSPSPKKTRHNPFLKKSSEKSESVSSLLSKISPVKRIESFADTLQPSLSQIDSKPIRSKFFEVHDSPPKSSSHEIVDLNGDIELETNSDLPDPCSYQLDSVISTFSFNKTSIATSVESHPERKPVNSPVKKVSAPEKVVKKILSRRIGLSKKDSTSSSISRAGGGGAQSLLSQFGFQKKPVIK